MEAVPSNGSSPATTRPGVISFPHAKRESSVWRFTRQLLISAYSRFQNGARLAPQSSLLPLYRLRHAIFALRFLERMGLSPPASFVVFTSAPPCRTTQILGTMLVRLLLVWAWLPDRACAVVGLHSSCLGRKPCTLTRPAWQDASARRCPCQERAKQGHGQAAVGDAGTHRRPAGRRCRPALRGVCKSCLCAGGGTGSPAGDQIPRSLTVTRPSTIST